jgi:hypothetical protein
VTLRRFSTVGIQGREVVGDRGRIGGYLLDQGSAAEACGVGKHVVGQVEVGHGGSPDWR